MPDFSLERDLLSEMTSENPKHRSNTVPRIVGVDEVGRGPWAGPVVAAAAWLDEDALPPALLERLDDSKKLSKTARENICQSLQELTQAGSAAISLGEATVAEIDQLNILQASLLAMKRAVAGLAFVPHGALIDGNKLPDLPCPARCIIKGDGRSLSIAAASIVAKVTRDHQMTELAQQHPGYGWERNQGYGTKEHREGIARLGVTLAHRRSFRPIREALELTL